MTCVRVWGGVHLLQASVCPIVSVLVCCFIPCLNRGTPTKPGTGGGKGGDRKGDAAPKKPLSEREHLEAMLER